jgi:hypothetical protein
MIEPLESSIVMLVLIKLEELTRARLHLFGDLALGSRITRPGSICKDLSLELDFADFGLVPAA